MGGASGITSMLSRAFETVKTLKTDYTSQQESINRLYRGPQIKPQLQEIPDQDDEQEEEESQSQDPKPEVVKEPEPSAEELLAQKLNAITYEDIQSMHYSFLNKGPQKETFDPKDIIDLDSDDETPNEHLTPQPQGSYLPQHPSQ